MQILQACEDRLSRQVQAPLPQDPPLQVQSSEVDLSVEHLRWRQRPDLLPLIVEARLSPDMGACHDTTHAASRA